MQNVSALPVVLPVVFDEHTDASFVTLAPSGIGRQVGGTPRPNSCAALCEARQLHAWASSLEQPGARVSQLDVPARNCQTLLDPLRLQFRDVQHPDLPWIDVEQDPRLRLARMLKAGEGQLGREDPAKLSWLLAKSTRGSVRRTVNPLLSSVFSRGPAFSLTLQSFYVFLLSGRQLTEMWGLVNAFPHVAHAAAA